MMPVVRLSWQTRRPRVLRALQERRAYAPGTRPQVEAAARPKGLRASYISSASTRLIMRRAVRDKALLHSGT